MASPALTPTPMHNDPTYGPQAQTPAQRAHVLRQMQAANPDQHTHLTREVQALYARYIAGELSWAQVQAVRYASTKVKGGLPAEELLKQHTRVLGNVLGQSRM